MNNFSPLPTAASDSRLSSPEGMAPNAAHPALQARRQKLRRVVAWVVGGATLLLCAGLVRATIHAHSEPAALESIANSDIRGSLAAPTSVVSVVSVASQAPTVPAPASVSPEAAVAPPASAALVLAPKPAKKTSTKATLKTTKRAPVVKSASVRH